MATRTARPEAFAKIRTTLNDQAGTRASIIDMANYEDNTQVMRLRGLEAGPGITLTVADADNSTWTTPDTKIIISSTGAPGGNPLNLLVYDAPIATPGQTVFSLPANTSTINTVTINGLETTNWFFSLGPPTVVLNMALEGYDLDTDDEVLVFYKTL